MTNTNEVGDQLRLDLLREALPYIQRFQGQTFVVKVSGKATEDQANLSSLAEELALLHQVGIRICVVHGGGKQLSDLASKLGIEQTIIEGRRVTDDATLEMAKMIFAGKINTDILAALRSNLGCRCRIVRLDTVKVLAFGGSNPPGDAQHQQIGKGDRQP